MRHISFTNKIIIYWLYDQYISNAEYHILLNDVLMGITSKTHFTFSNLDPNST